MNIKLSRFSKGWIWRGLALVALGAVLLAVQQGLVRRNRPAIPSVAHAPLPETQALPDPVVKAELPPLEIPVAATPIEKSPVAVFVPAKEAAVVPAVSGRAIAPPLYRAVPVARNGAPVGVGLSGTSGTPTVDPPLAFTAVPQDLTPEQQTALAKIQEQFFQAIGDANQDPADPAYQKRWLDAQSIADQKFKALFGWTAFSQMQVERAMNSYAEIQLQ